MVDHASLQHFRVFGHLSSFCVWQHKCCICLSGKDALKFAGDNIDGYGISRGLESPLKTVSVCFWVNVPTAYASDHFPTMVSYATLGGSDN